jgi:hypothetical protein
MNELDYRRIADKVNKIMRSYYDIDRRPGSKTDICMLNRPEIWEGCEPYLEHLPEVWERWKLENEGNDEIQAVNNPYIKALDAYRVIDRLFKKIEWFQKKDEMKRYRIILENWELAQDITKNSPYKLLDYHNSVEVEWRMAPIDKWSPTQAEERRVIYKVSEQILKELKLRDISEYE